jgi:hypothetical protein
MYRATGYVPLHPHTGPALEGVDHMALAERDALGSAAVALLRSASTALVHSSVARKVRRPMPFAWPRSPEPTQGRGDQVASHRTFNLRVPPAQSIMSPGALGHHSSHVGRGI